ncbi:hypothetical protein FKR81_07450 [Lentzea tibetensis]|uniref:Uncharacterized protein n=1 Tax=Lentzea tibetensis TaxID=2591470 RepID=A0A563EYW8_9PSEU|nr:hypothetical protein [Lentzea tibetensis]TWP52937.1 hypothetical protein FKR81_07450 [Lentzea tibetensis]
MKLQRDQVVAASLVGTVVVVLGFASGIGRVAQGGVAQAQTPPSQTRSEQPHPADHAPQPVAHNPAPVAHQPGPGPHVPAPTHPHPTAPPSTPTTTPTQPTKPAAPCDAGAIAALLKQLGVLVGELPIVGELTGGALAVDGLSLVDKRLVGAVDPALLTGLLGSLGGSLPLGKLPVGTLPLGGTDAAPADLSALTGLLGGTCRLVVDQKTGRVTGLLDQP